MTRRRSYRYVLVMSVGALGIVYGDIGTSPLYAFREAFVAADGLTVDRSSVLGILSLMFWALVIVVSVKYLAFVMRADNHGEGGILALTALVDPLAERWGARVRWVLLGIGLFGTALLYGDGMITPAISVLAAVEGLEVAAPQLDPYVVPIAIVIIVGLFAVQHRGTASIGFIFGPIMLVWFAALTALGIGPIIDEPSVVTAFVPTHAVSFVASQPLFAFLTLGAIFLVVTGSEALYADMGHFGRRPIRIGWFALVFPALVINYMGQGALLLSSPDAITSPFFEMAPSWAVFPLVILATLATVIASQALISGAFSLTMQAIQLGYLPRMDVDHTSPREVGQVYVSAVNWALMAACASLVLTFRSSSNLAAAYGVAVTSTMVITTVLLYVVMIRKWHWHVAVAIVVAGFFLAVDLTFLAANILKVPAGGWLPLAVGLVVYTAMITWKRGRNLVAERIRRGQLAIERFVASIADHPQQRVPGTAVYMFPDPGATPPALLTNLRHNDVLHETIAVVAVRTTGQPRVPKAGRATVRSYGQGIIGVTLDFGFFESPDVPRALSEIVDRDFGFDSTDTTYVLGRESVVSTARPGMARWRERLFALMHRNARDAARYFELPMDDVLEIGSRIDI